MPLKLIVYALFISCCLLLTYCTKAVERPLLINQQLVSPYAKPAQAYLAMATNQEGHAQQSLQLKAAGRLIHDGQWQQGQLILTRMKQLPDDLQDEKNLLLAKIDLIRERPRSAIAKLAKVVSASASPLYYQAQFHELLAEAYQSTGNAAEAVSERIKLTTILPDNAAKTNNLRALWLALTTLPVSELNTMAVEASEHSELKGWMQLAVISRKAYDHPHEMMTAIDYWQSQYPQHPANALLHPARVENYLFSEPRFVALLLPLSGPLAGPGNAIRDGFMAAHAQHAKNAINVRFYDTHAADAANLYERAVKEGAQYVVGPLSKADVTKVAALSHPVPTLLLNEAGDNARPNSYQFGLSPTNEARQVAAKARKNGHTQALVIAPQGLWGEEVVQAFTAQWQANGGQIADTLYYHANENLSKSLRDLLRISDSDARKKALKRLLGRKIEATPRRRRDFDMVFLLAYPSKARQIMPLLKYYYAGDVPVYATSSVYAGAPNSMKDRDLDGIIFCDMPWMFHHNLAATNWPEQLNSYNRLYALGMDGYALSSQLNQLLLFPAMGVREKSGVLYLKPNGQVARILNWGQFKQGVAKPLSEKRMA